MHTLNPFVSLRSLYASKARCAETAVRALEQWLERSDLTHAQRSALLQARDGIFEARAEQLRQAAQEHAGKLGDPREVEGPRPARGLPGRLFAGAQQRARKAHVRALIAGHRTSSNTPEIDEASLIEDTLRQVLRSAGLSTRGLGRAFQQAMRDAG